MASIQMCQNRRGAGRFPHKQREILAFLAEKIQNGDLKPGDRLPVREELCSQFDTTTTTIQRAIDNMVADGFLETVPRQGTFVAGSPPCCYRFGLAFPAERGCRGWRGLDQSILDVAEQVSAQSCVSFLVYAGISEGRDAEVSAELSNDIILKRVAGVIFTSSPFMLRDTPILDLPGVGRISIQSARKGNSFPVVDFESNVLIPKAIDFLKDKGCQRIALITQSDGNTFQEKNFQAALAHRGLAIDPAFIHGIPLSSPHWAVNLTMLLLHADNINRPDGLLILDDTLTPYVLEGVSQSQCQVNRDLHIVSHCNFPQTQMSSLPVTRVGYDIREFFTRSLESLWAQHRGEACEEKVILPLRFEDEIHRSRLVIPEPFCHK